MGSKKCACYKYGYGEQHGYCPSCNRLLDEDFEEFIKIETEAAIEGGIINENTGLPFEIEEA